MPFERWHELKALFAEASDLSPDEQNALLARLGQSDPDLSAHLANLLRIDKQPGGILSERPKLPDPEFVAAGQRIGDYLVVREIGRGALSVVYLAESAEQGRVAIKILPRSFLSAELLERLDRERQILSKLSHPCIPKLLGAGETVEGNVYLVIELVEGVSLDQFCNQPDLDLNGRLRLFGRICEAVAYAHSQGVVHRDIKPTNILVTSDGTPMLLDFGVAGLLSERAMLTLTNRNRFTLEYASPEQLREFRVNSPATDIYSLGVVLYQILTGVLPYASGSGGPFDILRSILSDQPVPFPAGSRVPKDLQAMVFCALEKEPSNRFGSVEEFRRGVDGFRTRVPAIVRRSQWRYRLAGISRSQTKFAAGVAAAVMLAFGAWSVGRSARAGHIDVYQPTSLTTFVGWESNPVFSPDGETVFFAWKREGKSSDVCRIAVQSGETDCLTDHPADDTIPLPSPDGNQLAFFRDQGKGIQSLILLDLRGRTEEALVEGYLNSMAWAPDGRSLVVAVADAPSKPHELRRLDVSTRSWSGL